jgi:hypothetical protein
MAMRSPGIRLDIERLVVDGLATAQRKRFVEAFTAECAAGLAAAAFVDAQFPQGRVDLSLAPDASAEALARALARGLVRLVSRP